MSRRRLKTTKTVIVVVITLQKHCSKLEATKQKTRTTISNDDNEFLNEICTIKSAVVL